MNSILFALNDMDFASFSNSLNCPTTAACSEFENPEFQDLCAAQSAVFLSLGAYELGDRRICQQSGGFAFSQNEGCKNDRDEVAPEDCSSNPECRASSADFDSTVFNNSPYDDIPLEELNGVMGQLQEVKKHWGESQGIFIKGKPFAYTAYVGSTIVIAFKGTSSDGDAVADVKFRRTTFEVTDDEGHTKEFSAHRGFVQYYTALQDAVIGAVEELSEVMLQNGVEVEELLVTGHSLGGAMANLCAVDLALKYPDVSMNLWTFGAPRVFQGNARDHDLDANSAFHGDVLLTRDAILCTLPQIISFHYSNVTVCHESCINGHLELANTY